MVDKILSAQSQVLILYLAQIPMEDHLKGFKKLNLALVLIHIGKMNLRIGISTRIMKSVATTSVLLLKIGRGKDSLIRKLKK